MKDKLEYLKTIETGIVVDAMDGLHLQGWMNEDIQPLDPASRIVGPAFTGQYHHVADPAATTYSSYDVIDMCEPGAVLIFAGSVGERSTGGYNIATAKFKRLAGIITDGMTRDVNEIIATSFPLFCGGLRIYAPSNNLKLTDVNVPVDCGGRLVRPGDIIVADRDGVVVIPIERLDDVIRQCKYVQACEAEMQEILAGARPVSDVKHIMKKKKQLASQ
ncbi:S-adenosylmethionine--2-demethylmenaquinone methyltransferase [Synergistales bacterium]|nr:S-adenosylmethionine--2-demethylmenaquinone methyltransferase [Synergistales bacterium]